MASRCPLWGMGGRSGDALLGGLAAAGSSEPMTGRTPPKKRIPAADAKDGTGAPRKAPAIEAGG